jgi:hypothetical protein
VDPISEQELGVLCDNLGEDIDALHSDDWMRVSTALTRKLRHGGEPEDDAEEEMPDAEMPEEEIPDGDNWL